MEASRHLIGRKGGPSGLKTKKEVLEIHLFRKELEFELLILELRFNVT